MSDERTQQALDKLGGDHLDVAAQIKQYEVQYNMSSADFMHQWLAGKLDDIYEFNHWAALVGYYNA